MCDEAQIILNRLGIIHEDFRNPIRLNSEFIIYNQYPDKQWQLYMLHILMAAKLFMRLLRFKNDLTSASVEMWHTSAHFQAHSHSALNAAYIVTVNRTGQKNVSFVKKSALSLGYRQSDEINKNQQ